MVKQGTNQMIRFFVYSNLKSWLQEGDNTKDIGAIRTFMIGGVAGAASVFGNTPVDVVKTRMQVSRDPWEDRFILFILNFEIMHDLDNQIG
jgi:solute carrier family 25 citrate transporter 1